MNHIAGDTAALAANLRTLCDRHGSVAAVCRKLNVNRQQFNKYLSGAHVPSSANLRTIANFFGLSVPILFSDPEEFRTLIDGNFFHAMSTARHLPEFVNFLSNIVFDGSVQDSEILGVYDRYQFSSIYKGFILKSAFCLYRNNNFLQHYYIERFPSFDRPGRTEYVFKYYGFSFPVADRLFTADFEGIQSNELTFGVYAQVKRNAKRFMFGIASGIAANAFRQPYSTKVALHYKGPGLLQRSHLKELTVIDRSDPGIPREVLQYLGDGSDMIQM
ncbi:XRE family transcriptional regulator [Mesorhizobium sp. M1A.F.Ca.IN.022.07.1.1]|uniref:helix-turn-helix domain-containing protein n=1 Tax=unclassified Mesorhizobium TaxID=325217 RepID=UPI0007FC3EE9|nr:MULTISPECIES: helix-turn-helix transcriptional regulator [unclassified Mesorhizobium]TGV91888.1 XRE family transcriptional regulator [Mesorhizobium sp. M00.F.Ca.ET.158.01.1.1]WIE90458.1 helix-turn-helix transcriptional regulator [Mesorhizobium sp. WSM4875]AZO58684.1 XRE family transcriptional regulator [Mesorhizobium sp. M1A.F.Ca.IN.022.06.1.1]MCT2578787.1 helix-turn-helix transcriptional regulator [Mesorhizobium sp. P13.3]MDF3167726.1 helix-turn-helix transcriptional regulator [Mesorhizobi